jgi:cyclophilin family peptidyl-prolyl cis-trans isomerase
VLAQLQKNHPNDVRIVYRHFPLPGHDKALIATQAAEAAGLQGKFWEMHDLIYAEINSWGGLTPEAFIPYAVDAAKKLGLDASKFADDLVSDAMVKKGQQVQQEAIDAKIGGTPLLLLNGRPYFGAIGDREYNAPADLDNLTSIVRLYQIDDRQFNTCPEFTVDVSRQYTAVLSTEKGDIVIQLFVDKAPVTVNSFVFLARQGWFDNTIFHRVIPNFVVQAGDPSASGIGSPGYAFRDEITNLKFDKEGIVGMANFGPNTNGSQFFITLSAQSSLNGKYTVFGQVIQGMDIVRKLTARDPSKGSPLPPGDKLLRVTIEEK